MAGCCMLFPTKYEGQELCCFGPTRNEAAAQESECQVFAQ
jgi:hypothetical protein